MRVFVFPSQPEFFFVVAGVDAELPDGRLTLVSESVCSSFSPLAWLCDEGLFRQLLDRSVDRDVVPDSSSDGPLVSRSDSSAVLVDSVVGLLEGTAVENLLEGETESARNL